MNIWIIEDNDDAAEALVGLIEAINEQTCTKCFETVHQTVKAVGSPDIVIVDITALCGSLQLIHHAYTHIAALANRHPGATIIINSAVPAHTAKEVVDDTLAEVPDADVRFTVRGEIDSMLDELIGTPE